MATTSPTRRRAERPYRRSLADLVRGGTAGTRREIAALGGTWGRVLAAPYWAWYGFHSVSAGDLAAAVAFNALMALIPLILLLASLGGLALQADELLQTALHAVLWAVPEADAEAAVVALVRARQGSPVLGAVGLFGFAWAGSNFVNCLARSLNRVYGARDRHFVHERLRAVLLVSLFALLALLVFVTATLPTLFVSEELDAVFRAWLLASGRVQAISYLAAFGAALVLFLFVYRVLPNAGQRLRDVWPGSLTAALLFVALLQVFPLYLRIVGGASRYGAFFGFIPLLVVWFSVLAHVLLFGAYVNATYHRQCRGDAVIAGVPLPGCGSDDEDGGEMGRS